MPRKTPHKPKKVMSDEKRKLYNEALHALCNLSTFLSVRKDADMYKSNRAIHALWEFEE